MWDWRGMLESQFLLAPIGFTYNVIALLFPDLLCACSGGQLQCAYRLGPCECVFDSVRRFDEEWY